MTIITFPSAITDLQHDIQTLWADLDWKYYDYLIELEDDEREVFAPDVTALLVSTAADLTPTHGVIDKDTYRLAMALAIEAEKNNARQAGLEVR